MNGQAFIRPEKDLRIVRTIIALKQEATPVAPKPLVLFISQKVPPTPIGGCLLTSNGRSFMQLSE